MDILRELHVTVDGQGEVIAQAEMAQIRAQLGAERVCPPLCSSGLHALTQRTEQSDLLLAHLHDQVAPEARPLLYHGLGSDNWLRRSGHRQSNAYTLWWPWFQPKHPAWPVCCLGLHLWHRLGTERTAARQIWQTPTVS